MRLILACDPNGGIGYQNKLPWDKIQGDLPRFKKLTENRIVVMGRNTWESLPVKPLPNRTNYVVTSEPYSIPMKIGLSRDGIYGISDIRILSHFTSNACIIGGSKLIKSAWTYITEVHLTRTFVEYTCDTFIDLKRLSEDFSLQYEEVNSDHSYEIWKRK